MEIVAIIKKSDVSAESNHLKPFFIFVFLHIYIWLRGLPKTNSNHPLNYKNINVIKQALTYWDLQDLKQYQ